MTLKFVEPHELPDTLNVLLYSRAKTGKSTAALSAPGPILYLNADGPNAARFARNKSGQEVHELLITSGAQMNDALFHLRSNPVERTVVLDTIGSIYAALLEEKANGGKATLPHYGDVTTALRRFVIEVRDMPVNLVILAQEHQVKDDATGVIERMPYAGTSNPAFANELMQQVDVIGYCGRVQGEDGTPRFMATLVDALGRRGGDRTDTLGTARDLDLSEWVATAAAGAAHAPVAV